MVLYEDNHLLVVNKPAGLATMGAAPGEPSLVDACKQYLKAKYGKEGNVYLGVVSRLDAVVSGVIVFARTSKSAARLNEQFREWETEKTYWAFVEHPPSPPAGTCVDWLAKDDDAHRTRIVSPETRDAKEARLDYRLLQTTPAGALVEVNLKTGRKHQIRVQFENLGCPILGDRKYGGRGEFRGGIPLHARKLTILHPTRKEFMTFTAPPPATWGHLGIRETD